MITIELPFFIIPAGLLGLNYALLLNISGFITLLHING